MVGMGQFAVKFALALTAATTFIALGAFGYKAGQQISYEVTWVFKIAFGFMPALLDLVIAFVVVRFPITIAIQRQLREKIREKFASENE